VDDLVAAFKGATVVFHCATAAPSAENAKNKEIMYAVNVQGTWNVIEACKICHVPSLVYVSSASVVFSGQDLDGVDESIPLPKRHVDFYTETKVGFPSWQKILSSRNGANCFRLLQNVPC
jgi:nucleoside-diphosphate-sugar epimerase